MYIYIYIYIYIPTNIRFWSVWCVCLIHRKVNYHIIYLPILTDLKNINCFCVAVTWHPRGFRHSSPQSLSTRQCFSVSMAWTWTGCIHTFRGPSSLSQLVAADPHVKLSTDMSQRSVLWALLLSIFITPVGSLISSFFIFYHQFADNTLPSSRRPHRISWNYHPVLMQWPVITSGTTICFWTSTG